MPMLIGFFFDMGLGRGRLSSGWLRTAVHPFPWSYYGRRYTQSPVNRLESQAIQLQFPAITGAGLESALSKALLPQNCVVAFELLLA